MNSPPPGLSFLNLPYHVRPYLRPCRSSPQLPINLNLEGGSREDYLQLCFPDGLLNQPAKDAYPCFYWKHIHNEDTVYVQQAYYSIFYSEDKFMIRRSLYNGLLALEKLNPKAIAHLTFLSI